ncbi:MAG: flagellar hook-associated protein FlgL [Myxococcota bacterium]|nr:flagellar hook-associated protein FlgL [Myxococcales bacterium]
MRITQSMLARVGIEQLRSQRNRLAITQERAATGLRINRPSDDPVDYRTTLYLKDALGQTGKFLRAIDLSRTRLQTTEEAIGDSNLVIGNLKTIAIEASNTSNQSPSARTALRTEVEQLFDQLLEYSNVRAPGGGYVFAGTESDTAAFQQAGSFVSGGAPPTVAFTGQASAIEVEIDEGVRIEVTADGSQVFQGTVDVFEVVGRLWQGIDANDQTLISSALGDLDRAFDQLSDARTRIGGSGRKADDFEERLRLQEQEFISQISFLEDADAYEVYSDLVTQESSLQASLQVTTRLLQPTLLDYL